MYMGTKGRLETLLMIKRCYDTQKDIPRERREKLKKEIHNEKIGLRNAYREQLLYEDGWEWHDYGDGSWDRMWGKIVYQFEMTKEEIENFKDLEWCHWYNPYEDGRDCTGVWFTTRIKAFVVDGKTFIYHFKSCDV